MAKPIIVLVIGNGFDIAHGLPTKYSDFLDDCKVIAESGSRNHFEENIASYIQENVWYQHLNDVYENKSMGDKWIDFEKELSLIIQAVDRDEFSLDETLGDFLTVKDFPSTIYGKKLLAFKRILTKKLRRLDTKKTSDLYTFREIRKLLFDDLQRLTCALEVYLINCVETVKCCESPARLKDLKPNYLISFNYTHTGERVFSDLKAQQVFHIHGECKKNDAVKTNNMVLGIDEYWLDDRKNTNTDYVIFKKFVQRIQKCTSGRTVLFLNRMKGFQLTENRTGNSGYAKKYEIHFFGHSLDVTDRDILVRLFDMPRSKITIYYHDKPTQGEYIANVIKLIGQDALNERLEDGSLKFVMQT